ncbi:MAG TPA: hypothetical protein G4O00_13395 [Thermoflexia bacterium]|nr:hypothetical protein [Thermoflexia bacterium]
MQEYEGLRSGGEGCLKCPFHGLRWFDRGEAVSGIEVILTRLVNDPQQAVLRGSFVGEHTVYLESLQRC